jgi:hypothetical protein
MIQPATNLAAGVNRNCCRATVFVLPAGVTALLPCLDEAEFGAARINSFALAGMGDGKFHVVGK